MSNRNPERTDSTKGSLIVVNLRGGVNTRAPVRKTLQEMKIAKRFNSTIVPDTIVYRGMLNAAKDHVAWCKADASTVEKILNSRAEKSKGTSEQRNSAKGAATSYAMLAKELEEGKIRLDGSQGIRNLFRLHPPRGGFKRSTRRPYNQGGVLGFNKDLPSLIEKMV
jgi:large subunit ribosomal protein L30